MGTTSRRGAATAYVLLSILLAPDTSIPPAAAPAAPSTQPTPQQIELAAVWLGKAREAAAGVPASADPDASELHGRIAALMTRLNASNQMVPYLRSLLPPDGARQQVSGVGAATFFALRELADDGDV